MSSEEYEKRELSVEERKIHDDFDSMEKEGNANPAVVVEEGRCVMINCKF